MDEEERLRQMGIKREGNSYSQIGAPSRSAGAFIARGYQPPTKAKLPAGVKREGNSYSQMSAPAPLPAGNGITRTPTPASSSVLPKNVQRVGNSYSEKPATPAERASGPVQVGIKPSPTAVQVRGRALSDTFLSPGQSKRAVVGGATHTGGGGGGGQELYNRLFPVAASNKGLLHQYDTPAKEVELDGFTGAARAAAPETGQQMFDRLYPVAASNQGLLNQYPSTPTPDSVEIPLSELARGTGANAVEQTRAGRLQAKVDAAREREQVYQGPPKPTTSPVQSNNVVRGGEHPDYAPIPGIIHQPATIAEREAARFRNPDSLVQRTRGEIQRISDAFDDGIGAGLGQIYREAIGRPTEQALGQMVTDAGTIARGVGDFVSTATGNAVTSPSDEVATETAQTRQSPTQTPAQSNLIATDTNGDGKPDSFSQRPGSGTVTLEDVLNSRPRGAGFAGVSYSDGTPNDMRQANRFNAAAEQLQRNRLERQTGYGYRPEVQQAAREQLAELDKRGVAASSQAKNQADAFKAQVDAQAKINKDAREAAELSSTTRDREDRQLVELAAIVGGEGYDAGTLVSQANLLLPQINKRLQDIAARNPEAAARINPKGLGDDLVELDSANQALVLRLTRDLLQDSSIDRWLTDPRSLDSFVEQYFALGG